MGIGKLPGHTKPIEFYRDDHGKPFVVSGHRRVQAMMLLAQQGVPGFKPEMRIAGVEAPKPTQDENQTGATEGS